MYFEPFAVHLKYAYTAQRKATSKPCHMPCFSCKNKWVLEVKQLDNMVHMYNIHTTCKTITFGSCYKEHC